MAGSPILAPTAVQQFFDNNGNPLGAGTLAFYLAGTSTPTPAYSDPGLSVPYANPIVLDAGGRIPGPGELWLDASVNYKEVLQNSSGATIWTADNLSSYANAVVSVSASGANQVITVPNAPIVSIEMTNSALASIAGFTGGKPGQLLVIRSAGTGQVDLLYQNAAASVTDRLSNFVSSGNTSLAAGSGSAVYVRYSGGAWNMLAHEQGAWISVPLSASNYSASAGMVWTVPSAGYAQRYRLNGRTLFLQWFLYSTGISGTAGNSLFLNNTGWGNYSAASTSATAPLSLASDAGTFLPAYASVTSASQIAITKTTGANWTVTASGTYLYGSMILDVT